MGCLTFPRSLLWDPHGWRGYSCQLGGRSWRLGQKAEDRVVPTLGDDGPHWWG